MAHFCETCGRDFTNMRCPRCGGPPSSQVPTVDDVPVQDSVLSVADDSLDHMIEEASRPTLATLLKRGIKNGTIVPSHDYAGGNTPTP